MFRWVVACLLCFLLPVRAADLLSDFLFFDVRDGRAIDMGRVDSESVDGFELLYATPGTGDIAEVAGHLLLRVKLRNNLWAEGEGVENPYDLVISFLADTEEGKGVRVVEPFEVRADCRSRNWFNLVEGGGGADEDPLASLWQSLKGLSGGFGVLMDLQTLGHALKSYTVEQDRDLLRYRLNFTERMKEDLLAHLFYVKEYYRPRYYFFSKNCGSILVQVIGEGIGDDEVGGFDPLVAPPHTLVGNLIRRGLATRIAPSFYSYRKRGLIAGDVFAERWRVLVDEYVGFGWPGLGALSDRDEFVRAEALGRVGDVARDHAALHGVLYPLLGLAQEADMLYADKGLVCEDYTSEAVAVARRIQQMILLESGGEVAVDVGALIDEGYALRELEAFAEGRPHTQLYSMRVGGGFYMGDGGGDGGVYMLGGALLRQDMGSRSSVAMQRGGGVDLGGVSLVGDGDGVREWRVTGLRLQKFRDSLDGVFSALGSRRGLGLGLSVLDFRRRELAPEVRGVIAGVSGLANVVSSVHYSDFLFVSLGADLVYSGYAGDGAGSLVFPLGVECLLGDSFWQWRGGFEFAATTRSDQGHEFYGRSSLMFCLGEVFGAEVNVVFSLDYQRVFSGGVCSEDEDRLLGGVSLEVNRW